MTYEDFGLKSSKYILANLKVEFVVHVTCPTARRDGGGYGDYRLAVVGDTILSMVRIFRASYGRAACPL